MLLSVSNWGLGLRSRGVVSLANIERPARGIHFKCDRIQYCKVQRQQTARAAIHRCSSIYAART
jgi:hypothetical protein